MGTEAVATDAHLRPASEQDLTDSRTLLDRLLRLDPGAAVRLQDLSGTVSLWAQPLGVVVRRDVRGALDVGDRTVPGGALAVALAQAAACVRLPGGVDATWRVTLPPRAGWEPMDEVPARALRDLTREAGALVRSAADPAAAGETLLDQEALRVSAAGEQVVLTVRLVVVLSRLGFLGGRPDEVVRIACTPAWARVAARHGTAYQRRSTLGPGLSSVSPVR